MCVGVIDFAFVFYTISLIDLCFDCHFITCFRVKLISCKNNIHLKTNTLWSVSRSEYYIQIMHICIDCSHGPNVNFRICPPLVGSQNYNLTNG